MILLKSLKKLKLPKELNSEFPFNSQVLNSLNSISFKTEVTFFVGENGTGKSTLLEGIGASTNLPMVGSRNFDQDETLKYAKNLAKYFKLSWTIKSNKGFFLRAEDFFGFTKRLNQMRSELGTEIIRLNQELPDGLGKDLAIGSIRGQIQGLTQRYGIDLDSSSHGESFLKLFQSRIKPNGLYLLDEPEAPLSPTRQMSLIKIIHDAVSQNCQFIIATHSPILMAYPDATILDFNSNPIKNVNFEDTEHVNITKNFLGNRQKFLDELLN